MFKFPVPFTLILAGPSGCGKTTFALKLLNNLYDLTKTHFDHILWCFSENGSIGDLPQIKNLRTCKGIPDEIWSGMCNKSPKLIVIDDLMTDREHEGKICDLFVKQSHHRNISVIFMCQNVFYQSRDSRTISLNTKYMVIFKNIRDKYQFFPLARQLYPDNPSDLLRVYKEATSKPFGYLFIDLNQETPDFARFRTDVFQKNYSVCYIPSEEIKKFSNDEEKEVSEFKKEWMFETSKGQQIYLIYA